MKKILLASAAIVGLVIAVPMFDAAAHDHNNGKKKLKYKVELAGDLCTAMVRSGAYTEMDADTLSAYCIHVATHIVDAPYDHTDDE